MPINGYTSVMWTNMRAASFHLNYFESGKRQSALCCQKERVVELYTGGQYMVQLLKLNFNDKKAILKKNKANFSYNTSKYSFPVY